jgi:hypothetical protein
VDSLEKAEKHPQIHLHVYVHLYICMGMHPQNTQGWFLKYPGGGCMKVAAVSQFAFSLLSCSRVWWAPNHGLDLMARWPRPNCPDYSHDQTLHGARWLRASFPDGTDSAAWCGGHRNSWLMVMGSSSSWAWGHQVLGHGGHRGNWVVVLESSSSRPCIYICVCIYIYIYVYIHIYIDRSTNMNMCICVSMYSCEHMNVVLMWIWMLLYMNECEHMNVVAMWAYDEWAMWAYECGSYVSIWM